MTSTNAFFSMLNSQLSELDKRKVLLPRKDEKLRRLDGEMQLVDEEKWIEIRANKQRQLDTIEAKYKELEANKIIRPKKTHTHEVPPQYAKLVRTLAKHKRRITDELAMLDAAAHHCYREHLGKRIRKCSNTTQRIRTGEEAIDFMLGAGPAIAQVMEKPRTEDPRPWCVRRLLEDLADEQDPEIEAGVRTKRPRSPPPFHLLDQPRKKRRAELPETRMTASARKTVGDLMRAGRKTAPPNDASAEVGRLTRLIETGCLPTEGWMDDSAGKVCPVCRVEVEWIKDKKQATLNCVLCGHCCASYTAYDSESWCGRDFDISQPFSYERRNHFIDCLRQRQGKESTAIPPVLISRVCCELWLRKMFDPCAIRPKHIRDILKKIGESNYYDHEVQIWLIVTGNRPPRLSDEQETQLIKMFDKIQAPYERRKGDRNNFLTYSYTIHKMMEILEYPAEVLEFYPLLRSRNKLEAQEEIWRLVCKDMDWPFYKSRVFL